MLTAQPALAEGCRHDGQGWVEVGRGLWSPGQGVSQRGAGGNTLSSRSALGGMRGHPGVSTLSYPLLWITDAPWIPPPALFAFALHAFHTSNYHLLGDHSKYVVRACVQLEPHPSERQLPPGQPVADAASACPAASSSPCLRVISFSVKNMAICSSARLETWHHNGLLPLLCHHIHGSAVH